MKLRSAFVLSLGIFVACGEEQPEDFRSISGYPNPFGPSHPQYAPQPKREKPLEVVGSKDGRRVFVSLQGTPDEPGHHVVAVDLASREVLARIEVGSSPTGLALDPSGRFVVAFNRFSNFVSVIDTERLEVVQKIPSDFYAIEGVFSPDGKRLFITNRWRDALQIWDLETKENGFRVLERRDTGTPVGSNPRDIAISDDGKWVAVAALTGMTVSLIDASTGNETKRIAVHAPVNGLVFAGDYLIVATLSASTHHLPFGGPDTNGDGKPGDSTPNVNFQDLQNELAVYRGATGEALFRYTSDTICCKDYRDVPPEDTGRYGNLLPPRSTWIVGGALPEQITTSRDAAGTRWVHVSYSASNQFQRFEVDEETGALTAGAIQSTTGHNPHGIAVVGDAIVVAHRLSETIGIYDLATGATRGEVVVGDVSGGKFPATDAEIGTLFNSITSFFTVDGDQSCQHCHREEGNIDKAFAMPLTQYPGRGNRMTPAYRGAADTRPWFFESAMDETNFKPVTNEFARTENFCCSDYTLWGTGLRQGCEKDNPPECASKPNASSENGFSAVRDGSRTPYHFARPTPYLTRDQFFLAMSEKHLGRTETFGDGVFFEDPISGERKPVKLDFDGTTRALGLFLMTSPRLLPNPNELDLASVHRGKALFESHTAACSTCHPAPTFAVSTDVNPLSLPLRMGPVITQQRAVDGINLDLITKGFLDSFPQAEMEKCEEVCGAEACAANPAVCDKLRVLRLGVPSLRGVWDRAPRLFHDGRARGLRSAIATPGHPVLREGERGFNERDGVIDSHGGTSHMSAEEVEDLIDFMLSL